MGKNEDVKTMEKALAEKEKAFDALLKERDKATADVERLSGEVEELKKIAGEALAEKEATMREFAVMDIPEEEPELSKAETALIREGCDAYGIGEAYLLKPRIERDKETNEPIAVIKTVGGAKVRYRKGDEKKDDFVPLTRIQVTGVNPDLKKRKPLTAGKKQQSAPVE